MVRRVPHHVLTLGGEPHRPAASESHLMSGRGQLLVDRLRRGHIRAVRIRSHVSHCVRGKSGRFRCRPVIVP